MKKVILSILLLVIAVCARAGASGDAASLMDRLHRFDISCIALEGFEKRTCGMEHIDAFTQLIRLEDRAATLEAVEARIKESKSAKSVLEEKAAAAPAPELNVEYRELALAAQAGDAEAAAELASIDDPALIPYLIALLETPGVIPSDIIRNKLADLEDIMDRMLVSGDAGLDAAVIEAAIRRESDYSAALKRGVIALEGTRRKFPPWLPFAYAYLVGLVPFVAGIIASVKYYGKLEPMVVAISLVVYLAYVCMHGYFQFIAPYN